MTYFKGNLWEGTDRKKNKQKPHSHLTFSVGETLDLSFGIECQNDVSVDKPDMVKDNNEAPEATKNIDNNDNFIERCFPPERNRKL